MPDQRVYHVSEMCPWRCNAAIVSELSAAFICRVSGDVNIMPMALNLDSCANSLPTGPKLARRLVYGLGLRLSPDTAVPPTRCGRQFKDLQATHNLRWVACSLDDACIVFS
jgi:hypothetical protein